MKKGSKHSNETKRKMSKSHKGQKGYWLGKKHSKLHRKRNSIAHIGKLVGSKNPRWKNGRKISREYIYILNPNHFFANPNGYIAEHRLVIEKFLERYLISKESCHHLNKIKDDNRPENLVAFTSESAHQRFHHNPDNVKPSEIIFDGRKLH